MGSVPIHKHAFYFSIFVFSKLFYTHYTNFFSLLALGETFKHLGNIHDKLFKASPLPHLLVSMHFFHIRFQVILHPLHYFWPRVKHFRCLRNIHYVSFPRVPSPMFTSAYFSQYAFTISHLTCITQHFKKIFELGCHLLDIWEICELSDISAHSFPASHFTPITRFVFIFSFR